MKLVSYEANGEQRLGVVHEGRVADLVTLAHDEGQRHFFESARRFLEAGDEAASIARALVTDAALTATAHWPALSEVQLKAPVPDPRKIFALAGNYPQHVREGGEAVVPKERQVPQVFTKPATCIIGPGEAIRLPGPICTSVDYEGELGVVIGKRCHYVGATGALEYVAGYLNVNDVSGRKLNVEVLRETTARTGFFDWLNGKWFDTFAPIGPFLVLKDEVPDPQALDLVLRVNGEVRQQASTGDMIFSVAETVAWISQFTTLEPGDIIATGTPSGIGATTGTFLQPGDVVEVEISRLGTLRNTVAPSLVSTTQG